MSTDAQVLNSLNRSYLQEQPVEACRVLERLSTDDAAAILLQQPVSLLVQVLEKLTPGYAEAVIKQLPSNTLAELFSLLSINTSVTLLSRLGGEQRQALLEQLSAPVRGELSALLEYPEGTAGRQMNPRVAVFNSRSTVGEAIRHLKEYGLQSARKLYLVNDELQLQSQVDAHKLLFAKADATLAALSRPVPQVIKDLDSKEEVIDKLETAHTDALPVVNADLQVVGVIEGIGVIDAVRDDIALDIQTMVGASREEKALSPALFAVKKRLPWLQINLVTAFLAASVVGMFEDTIARFTALAILMPIAAGQSGNTGAQALAVTMRGLTLREISMRDWFRMLRKEFASGLLNGIGVAIVCGIGVYFWSGNFGLALVMASAMIISMTIAGSAGAVVPMVLKRFGLDPAQSSSIVLTTITDITGFMSFLGIATLLASMLEAGA
jgi:magnesium transporter